MGERKERRRGAKRIKYGQRDRERLRCRERELRSEKKCIAERDRGNI